ncbi:non-classical arabinogalactan protein 31 [Eucalyptus grandis]|uniref:non-classical arabinogalactan protein 31 n=1 Tax=Eucalyptus grandis TaxID=71139 RepID=UPI00192EFCFD|nr:non-classical arabinogalactan protein 31 [Eucalyptus grandis]
MESAPSKAFLLVQLLLLLSCFQEASCFFPHPPAYPPTQHHDHDYHHHHHAPGHPPVLPPVHPPSPYHSHPLIPAPALVPSHPPAPIKPPFHWPFRTFIAIQGVVYCKSCEYTLNGAKPIIGAVVKLWCKNTKYPAWATATTDKNGYFFLEAPKTVSNFATHKCKVFLVSSPIPSCSEPSNLNGGSSGAPLKFEKLVLGKPLFTLYSVGPLAFEPKCRAPGPK